MSGLLTRSKILLGTSANDGTGDPLRTAGGKINDAFDLGGWDAVYALASDFVTTSLTAVDVTNMKHTLAANKLYEIDALIIAQSTTTNGVRTQFSNPNNSGATVLIDVGYMYRASATSWVASGASAFGTSGVSTNLAQVANVPMIGIIKGWISTGAAGTPGDVQMQFLKLTAGTGTMMKGSYLRIRELL